MRTVHLEFCRVEQREGSVWTVFHDGAECPATAHQTPHYYVIAHRLGYGDDIWAYCFEHEVAHAFVEQELHRRPSRVLWALAHGGMLKGTEAAYEEIAAQTLQRWIRANERPILSGVDWDGLKARALELLAA